MSAAVGRVTLALTRSASARTAPRMSTVRLWGVLAVVVLAGCGPGDAALGEDMRDSVEARLGAQPPVRLRYAVNYECPPVGGCALDERLEGVIDVLNIAYEKQVNVVFYSRALGQWTSAPATYVGPGQNGTEGWAFRAPATTEFAISYTVQGQTYWDNNFGQNYHLQRYATDAVMNGAGIGEVTGWLLAGNHLSAWVLVENRSYEKHIRLEYSTDGWSTSASVDAQYSQTTPSGLEWWHVDEVLPGVDPAQVRFRAQAQFVGSAASDDNSGQFYRVVDTRIVR